MACSAHNDPGATRRGAHHRDGGEMNNQRQLGGPVRNPLDVLTRPARSPDLVLRYGDGAEHVADVHLPRFAAPEPGPDGARAERAGAGGLASGTGELASGTGGLVSGLVPGLVPLTIFLHGGFWRAEYGREHTAPLAEALADAGFAVCAPEYRRTGQPDGGWPGTFDDVAVAVDRLPELVAQAAGGVIDPNRVVLAGHSAGGHLALWAASRHLLPAGSPWRAQGQAGCGVVALAAVSDLAASYRWRLGQWAAEALMGGGAEYFAGPVRRRRSEPSGASRSAGVAGARYRRRPGAVAHEPGLRGQGAGGRRDRGARADVRAAAWHGAL